MIRRERARARDASLIDLLASPQVKRGGPTLDVVVGLKLRRHEVEREAREGVVQISMKARK